MECIVAGIPPPTVYWTLDGHLLQNSEEVNIDTVESSNGHLTFHIIVYSATEEYSGNYTCIASNDAGEVSYSFSIQMEDTEMACKGHLDACMLQ